MSELLSNLPYLTAAWIAVIGLYGMSVSRNFIRMIMCLCVFQSGVWILLLSIGLHSDATAPIFYDIAKDQTGTDPVMQALSITDIVVGAALAATLLALAVHIHKRCGTLDPDKLDAIKK